MLTERLIPVSDTPSVSLFVAESAASSLRIYVDADAPLGGWPDRRTRQLLPSSIP